MADNKSCYLGVPCRKMPPTLKHRPAIWECLLGTVYAMNEARESKYFDYDWDAAKEWAGIADKSDIRVFRNKEFWAWSVGKYPINPQVGGIVLWVENS